MTVTIAKTASVKLDGVAGEEKRETFRQATLTAWREYRETGLHVSAEEADAWLASWGTDDELPAPVCHK
ncbi:MAG: transcriptional regulator [Candidatus Accumulibacter sp.]|jgi:predicted transcriptional regulator|nr:transcriptional regulator [Accumulibacter sp.]